MSIYIRILYPLILVTLPPPKKKKIPHTDYNLKLIVETAQTLVSLFVSLWVKNEMELHIQKERIKVGRSACLNNTVPDLLRSCRWNFS